MPWVGVRGTERRDYREADDILEELGSFGVSVDDARRQRTWWVGRRVDGRERGESGATASSGRRGWFNDGDRVDGDRFDEPFGRGGRGGDRRGGDRRGGDRRGGGGAGGPRGGSRDSRGPSGWRRDS